MAMPPFLGVAKESIFKGWIVARASTNNFGVITAIEMITVAVIYIPVANFSDKAERKPFVVVTFSFFTIFPIILYYNKNFGTLVVAFLVRGSSTNKNICFPACIYQRLYGFCFSILEFF